MIVFTSCDPVYLQDHGAAFAASAALSDNNAHIHVVEPNDATVHRLDRISDQYKKLNSSSTFTYSYGECIAKYFNDDHRRTIYACDRFVTVSDLIYSTNEEYLVVDVDCLIMKHIDPIDCDVCLFKRESLPGTEGWEKFGTQVAAGAVYYKPSAMDFIDYVSTEIQKGPFNWFLDQVCIAKAHEKFRDTYKFKYFDTTFLDWEFLPETTIWTGKGDRKHFNKTYVSKKEYFKSRMI